MTIRNEPERNEVQQLQCAVQQVIVRLDALEAKQDSDLMTRVMIAECEIEDVKSEPVVDKPWPQDDDEYWLLHSSGCIVSSMWNADQYDFDRLSRGNVFRTKEEAEKADQLCLAMNELKVMSERSCALHPDRDPCVGLLWKSFTQEWEAVIYSQCAPLGGILFLTKQDALEAIEIVDPKYKGVL